VLAAGHFVVDFSVGMLSPLLPAFKKALQLTDLRTSLILASVTFSSSFIQPLFGMVSDRVRATWFLWAGVAAATLGIGLAGVAPSYWMVLALVVVGGLGVGAYHPEAARLANHFAGSRKATGVAWFTVGGNIGFAMGPLLVALLIPHLEQRTALIVAVPGAIALAVLLANLQQMHVPVQRNNGSGAARKNLGPMVMLVTTVSLRTWAQFGIMAIAPLYLTDDRGFSGREQGLAIFAFVIVGALGTVVGSPIADAIGGRPMLAGSLLLSAPCIAGFIVTDGPISMVLLAGAGFMLMGSFSATVVMGQAYMPDRLALAAAWVLGFGAIGAATPWLPIVGWISDVHGRDVALWVVAAAPIAGAALAILTPHPRTDIPT
jgi:FSR family fosmidomycin resistance protein-like MFS transporter